MAERSAFDHRRRERHVVRWWQTPLAQGVGLFGATLALQRTGILPNRDVSLIAAAALACAGMMSGSVTHFGDRFGDSVTHFGDRFGDSVTHLGDGVARLGDGVASIGASLDGVGAGVRAFSSAPLRTQL
jgi:hypothetical protein